MDFLNFGDRLLVKTAHAFFYFRGSPKAKDAHDFFSWEPQKFKLRMHLFFSGDPPEFRKAHAFVFRESPEVKTARALRFPLEIPWSQSCACIFFSLGIC